MASCKPKDADDILIGILMALAPVYQMDAETVAEEIVGICDECELLRVAKETHNPVLLPLWKTVQFLHSQSKKGKRK